MCEGECGVRMADQKGKERRQILVSETLITSSGSESDVSASYISSSSLYGSLTGIQCDDCEARRVELQQLKQERGETGGRVEKREEAGGCTHCTNRRRTVRPKREGMMMLLLPSSFSHCYRRTLVLTDDGLFAHMKFNSHSHTHAYTETGSRAFAATETGLLQTAATRLCTSHPPSFFFHFFVRLSISASFDWRNVRRRMRFTDRLLVDPLLLCMNPLIGAHFPADRFPHRLIDQERRG